MLDGLSILVVEDEPMLALDLASTIEDLGGIVIGPVATVAEALLLLERERIAAAVLDANLADRDITPVVLRFIAEAVPFVIHTGTGLPAALAAEHPALPVVMKPTRSAEVIATLVDRMKTSGTAPAR